MTLRTQLLGLGCLMALLGIWDFAGRLHVGRDPALRHVRPEVPATLPRDDSPDAIRRRLLDWLPAIAGSAYAARDAADSTAWQFTLLGVFTQRSKAIAVVAASLPVGGPTEKLRVVEGDTLHDWAVTRIDGHGVTLTHDAETRHLTLFRRRPREAGAGPGPS
jgi:hypothetical protein